MHPSCTYGVRTGCVRGQRDPCLRSPRWPDTRRPQAASQPRQSDRHFLVSPATWFTRKAFCTTPLMNHGKSVM